jgi:metal-dependent amidase/aminoacylase/carboxypeptidase family protein
MSVEEELQAIFKEIRGMREAMADVNNRLNNIEDYLEKQGAEKEVGKVEKPTGKPTAWKQSKKNPKIEWCLDVDANPSDLEDAKAKRGGMWTLANNEGGLSIFRRTK